MKTRLTLSLLAAILTVSGQETAQPETYQSPLYNKITSIALSRDGKTLFASDTAGHVFFWGRDGSLRKILRANVHPIADIAVSADGKYLATITSDHQVTTWNTSGEKLDDAGIDVLPIMMFTSSGDSLLYATPHGLFKGSIKDLANPVKINDSYFSFGTVAVDNNCIVAGSGNALNLISLADESAVSGIVSCGEVKKVESRGNLICSLCDDGSVQLFEMNGLNIKQVATAKTGMGSVSRLIITGDKKILMMDEEKVVMWNPASGKFYNVNGLPEGMTAFAYSDNGNFYAGNQNGEIVSWSAAAGSEIPRYQSQVGKPETKPNGYKIETTSAAIPISVNGRAVNASQSVEVRSSTLDIYVWDDEREDGDTISLNLNGEWILSNYMITGERKKLTVSLNSEKPNYLVLYAHNLGRLPPNTAVVSFHDGKEERKLTVESDLKRCGAVAFRLKK